MSILKTPFGMEMMAAFSTLTLTAIKADKERAIQKLDSLPRHRVTDFARSALCDIFTNCRSILAFDPAQASQNIVAAESMLAYLPEMTLPPQAMKSGFQTLAKEIAHFRKSDAIKHVLLGTMRSVHVSVAREGSVLTQEDLGALVHFGIRKSSGRAVEKICRDILTTYYQDPRNPAEMKEHIVDATRLVCNGADYRRSNMFTLAQKFLMSLSEDIKIPLMPEQRPPDVTARKIRARIFEPSTYD